MAAGALARTRGARRRPDPARGLLLIVPGFLSDVLGAIALLPPTRALLRGQLARHVQSRFVVQATRFAGASGPYDVDSTATDVDQPQLHG